MKRRTKVWFLCGVFWREFGVSRVNMLSESERSSCCSEDKDRSFLTLIPFKADNWEVCVPVSLQLSRQLLQFIACKCSHMVISSLTFPCEYGSSFIMTLKLLDIRPLNQCWSVYRVQQWISVVRTVRTVFEACRMQHTYYCCASIHGAQQCSPPLYLLVLQREASASFQEQWEEPLKHHRQFFANANEHHRLLQ